MRNILLLTAILITNYCHAQCPFSVTLSNKGSVCLGADTLVVSLANKLASIKWYKDEVFDTTINAVINSYASNGYNGCWWKWCRICC